MTFDLKSDGKRFVKVTAGALVLGLSIKIFGTTGGIIPGGISGLSVLLQNIFQKFLSIEIPYAVINIALNSVPVYIGFRFIGKKFTLLSLWMIVVSSIAVDMIPSVHITSDMLLIAVFGGIIHGTGISLALLGDATSGGTDFIAIYHSQKSGDDSFNMILAFNAVLLCSAGVFFGWDKALYSIIYQYISTQVLHILYRNYQQQTLFVVTTKAQEICDAIYKVCHHGATMIDAEGSHAHTDYKLVYSVITVADSKKAMQVIKDIDPDAFVNSIRTTELRGNFYIRPRD